MKSSQKPLILSPQDSIADIIYQIKRYVLQQDKTLIYIPEGMYSLYNSVNRGLLIHTIKQLIGRYSIELFSADHTLVSLLQNEQIPISTSSDPPKSDIPIGLEPFNLEETPYTDFLQESASNSQAESIPSSAPLFDAETPAYISSDKHKPIPTKKEHGNSSVWKWVWGLFICGIIVLAVIVVYFPEAEIKIVSNKESLSKDFDINFDPSITDISVENRTIPSTVDAISASVEGTYEGTGNRAGNTKASGMITIKNETTTEQQLIATTRFLSESGKQFRLSKTVTVPAKGEVKAEITADGVGESYNIKPGKLTIPGLEDNKVKYTGIYGELETAINNGAVADSAIITEEDITKARLDLQKKLSEVINTQISERKDTKSLVVETKLTDITYTGLPTAGDQGRSFTVKASTSANGVFYKEENLNTIMKSLLESQVLDSKSLSDTLTVTLDTPEKFSTKDVVKTRAYVKYSIIPELNMEEVKNDLILKTPSQAEDYLKKIEGVNAVNIQLNPGLLPVLPVLPSRIRIIIE